MTSPAETQSPADPEQRNPAPAVVARNRRRSLPLKYIVNKTLSALVLLLFVTIFNFFLFRVMPGDPAKTFAPRGRNDNPEALLSDARAPWRGQALVREVLPLHAEPVPRATWRTSFSQHTPVTHGDRRPDLADRAAVRHRADHLGGRRALARHAQRLAARLPVRPDRQR